MTTAPKASPLPEACFAFCADCSGDDASVEGQDDRFELKLLIDDAFELLEAGEDAARAPR